MYSASTVIQPLRNRRHEPGSPPIPAPKDILASNLKRLRVSAGLSQEELADRAGLHRTYVSSVERAQRNVSLENIFRLATAVGTAPEDLLKPIPNGAADELQDQ